MALLSPGIQLFESSVTPSAEVAASANGVATLGYSTRGPVNKLTKISSVSKFAEVFGDPIADYPYAHIMAQSVLANNTDVYFMRLADPDTSANSSCPVVSNFEISGAKIAIKDSIAIDESGYFMAHWEPLEGHEGLIEPSEDPWVRITMNLPVAKEVDPAPVFVKMAFARKFGPAGEITNILYASIADVVDALQRSEFGSYYDFKQVGVEGTSVESANIGILIEAKNSTVFSTSAAFASLDIGSIDDTSGSWKTWTGNSEFPASVIDSAILFPLVITTGKFGGKELRNKSTLSGFVTIDNYNHFNLIAKYPGSSMNGIKVVKTTVKSSVGLDESWTVAVYDGETILESRNGITPDNFVVEMGKFSYIDIDDISLVTDKWEWKDGTWCLGYGEALSNGDYWPNGTDTIPGDEETKMYTNVFGDDGFPTVEVSDNKQYSESKSVNLYLKALGSDEFVNTDEYSFSILATPGMQNTMVQNAAINVCATRGDSIYLADVPYDKCLSKQGIDDVVTWANGNSGFQSSYCAIYYGWFAQTNPYDTDNSIMCPASCFIAPKMVALDQSMGEFYAPAGISRGGIICSDFSYSPDQKDRDKLVGDDNVVNPISYSNTRGVVIMAQKTTDRTTSPLNRVGIRRMTNMIKRNLRSRLVALLFEPNNEVARSRARQIVDNVMAGLRSSDCIESYDINVVSGTGANRNDLNVYLSYAPYGLIEKIYVYLNITDVEGVTVTEAVS